MGSGRHVDANSGRKTASIAGKRRGMASIGKKNTKPELIVRRELTRLGVRYRIHVTTLPGCPDVVSHSRRLVIFVHGCLWHLHDGCALVRIPKSLPEYWPKKLTGNKERDRQHAAKLHSDGWRVEVIWECETRDEHALKLRLDQILSATRAATA